MESGKNSEDSLHQKLGYLSIRLRSEESQQREDAASFARQFFLNYNYTKISKDEGISTEYSVEGVKGTFTFYSISGRNFIHYLGPFIPIETSLDSLETACKELTYLRRGNFHKPYSIPIFNASLFSDGRVQLYTKNPLKLETGATITKFKEIYTSHIKPLVED